jgi:uncharacterized protein (DUF1800 family)
LKTGKKNNMPSNQIKNQHLLWRAAFGPMVENANQLENISPVDLWDLLKKTSSKKPVYINVASNPVDGLVKGIQNVVATEKERQEQAKARRKQAAQDLKSLNLSWLNQMINSEAQLREKMSLFWHGHFACRVINIYFQQQMLHEIRTNALGDFGTLLRNVSKSPAMLLFLNNQQNKKQHPNENFAREVMELFTMGRGNYTEQDVKEAARAFTGWATNARGEFVDRKNLHDTGLKTFLGKTGNFDGDDILDIILEQEATAKFITEKVYRFFVNDTINTGHVTALAHLFYRQNYDILKLMENIFMSDWFYADNNVGNRIKSPVELLVGIRRLIPMELEKPEAQLIYERVLGQVLFYPPNVAGWPGGTNWIDSSTLMVRLRLAKILTNTHEFSVRPKNDDDVMMGKEGISSAPKTMLSQNKIDWAQVEKVFLNVAREDLFEKVSKVVLQSGNNPPTAIIQRYIDGNTRRSFIKTAMVQLMSTPEYQLC